MTTAAASTALDARRRVCDAVAQMLDLDSAAAWLFEDDDGNELAPDDRDRMTAAAVELADEMRRRASP